MMSYSQGRLNNSTEIQPLTVKRPQERTIAEPEQKFSNILKSAIEHVNKVENEANIKTEQLATNKIEDLHDVMITAQKASITVEAAVQVQQKVIDAYNEMMRMQV